MNENQVCLDTICEVEDKELYRFITEELFQEEIDDMRIPGMFSHYTYEEFHPNHEYDLQRYTTEFIQSYLNKSSEFYIHELSSEATSLNWHNQFRDSFSAFKLETLEIIDLHFDLETALARVDFYCDFNATVEGSNNTLKFTGKGMLNFVHQWDFWYVNSVSFPKSELTENK